MPAVYGDISDLQQQCLPNTQLQLSQTGLSNDQMTILFVAVVSILLQGNPRSQAAQSTVAALTAFTTGGAGDGGLFLAENGYGPSALEAFYASSLPYVAIVVPLASSVPGMNVPVLGGLIAALRQARCASMSNAYPQSINLAGCQSCKTVRSYFPFIYGGPWR